MPSERFKRLPEEKQKKIRRIFKIILAIRRILWYPIMAYKGRSSAVHAPKVRHCA